MAQYVWAHLTLHLFEIVSLYCSPLHEQRKLALKMLGILQSHPKSAGQVLPPPVYVDSGDLNSSPHTCGASALSTGPSPSLHSTLTFSF